MSTRVTFVRKDVDLGEEVADYVIARISYEQACQHYISSKMYKLMEKNGVKRVVCPLCGTKCNMS